MYTRTLLIVTALLAFAACMSLPYPELEEGVEGELQDIPCQWDHNLSHCMGTCYKGQYCVEVQPKTCQCANCAYDYNMNTCIGQCSHGMHCGFIMGASNTTCGCAGCSWTTSRRDQCQGDCQGAMMCQQLGFNTLCQCANEQCSYDYASQKCQGKCAVHSQGCKEYGPGHCGCA
ncbi:hypothetical protein KIPB_007801 [Kipferlia bialata]|uniref:Uncharacterized protein n=1 Tax=Kipferlia bialata TaxID=797122 RepID=A0A9K3CZJ2_9EUKA|nr:hypothetical protein KIPB_007801 [Kipferlia bialata]|eukprot:g7801.t1